MGPGVGDDIIEVMSDLMKLPYQDILHVLSTCIALINSIMKRM